MMLVGLGTTTCNADGGTFIYTAKQALGSGALTATTSYQSDTTNYLALVSLHFSSAPTSVETIKVYLDSRNGANYDTLLATVSTVASSTTDVTFIVASTIPVATGDQITVTCTNNTGAGTVYVTVVTDQVQRSGNGIATYLNGALVATSYDLATTLTSETLSSRATYIASVSGQDPASAIILSLEASAGTGIKVQRICSSMSPATASAAVTVTVQRRTTASSGGTALTAEGTGATAVTKLDPSSSNFGGVARLGGTPGTGGAVIDQWGYVTGTVANNTGLAMFCMPYAIAGTKPIYITAGTANGITVNISAHGAGALLDGAISILFTVE